jgi:hypothetical protein
MLAIQVVLILPLTNASALGGDVSAFGGLTPELYSRSLLFYPQALEFDTQSARAGKSDKNTESLYKFQIKFSSVDAAQQTKGALRGFPVPRRNWEQNYIQNLNLKLSALEDRVQFSVRQSQSFYAADPNYLRVLASKDKNKNLSGKERFLFREVALGTALSERLETKIFESNLVGLSTFASRSEIDSDYESLVSQKKKDEFATANRSNNTVGAKVRLESFSLTNSYTTSSQLSGGSTATQAGQEQTIGLDLTDLHQRTGKLLPPAFWALAPSYVYVGNFVRQTSFKTAAEGPPDQTTGTTAGATWGWKGGYASVGYYNYYLDSRRSGYASYDSAGHGLNASVSAYGPLLEFYAGISDYRSDDLAPYSRAINHGQDAYSMVTFKPAGFPDIVLGGTFGRYEYDSSVYAITSDTNYWSASLGFEFSKFLPSFPMAKQHKAVKGTGNGPPSLKFFYRYYNEINRGIGDATTSDSHFVGVMFRESLD